MSITTKQVRHVARLARLAVTDDETASYAADLGAILDLVDQMQTRDTSGVEPLASPLDATQRLRPDAVTEVVDRDSLQAGAPATDGGLYLVPQVID